MGMIPTGQDQNAGPKRSIAFNGQMHYIECSRESPAHQGTAPATMYKKPLAFREALPQHGPFERLLALAQRTQQLQRALNRVLPPPLAALVHVGGQENGQLLLQADSNAIAGKLRQLLPTLLRTLQPIDPAIQSLKVQVQPQQQRRTRRPRPGQALTPETLQAFSHLAQSLPPSPLRSAVEHLLAQRRGPAVREDPDLK